MTPNVDELSTLTTIKSWLLQTGVQLHSSFKIALSQDAAVHEGLAEAMDYMPRSLGIFLQPHSPFIPIGTVVASIPLHAVLSPRNSALAAMMTIQDDDELSNWPNPSTYILATHLLYEMLLGPRSRWQGYIASLPCFDIGSVTVAYRWQDEALQWARGTEIERVLAREPDSDTTLTSFFNLHAHPMIQAANADLQPTLERFTTAHVLVSSRAFVVDLYHGLSMVPLADMYGPSNLALGYPCSSRERLLPQIQSLAFAACHNAVR